MSDEANPAFSNFGKLVPGFDFLQNLATQATQAAGQVAQKLPQLPSMSSWVAPTLNVEELDKRIQELKAVQFWLDQNAMALKATIQALEVQKMTLATLKGMNFSMAEMASAFKLKAADAPAGGAPQSGDKARAFAGLEVPPTTFGMGKSSDTAQSAPRTEGAAAAQDGAPSPSASDRQPPASRGDGPAHGAAHAQAAPAGQAPASALPGIVDPVQWWGALTQQFQAIAADAMKEAATKTGIDSSKGTAAGLAKDAMKSAADMATGMAKSMADTAQKTIATGAQSLAGSAQGITTGAQTMARGARAAMGSALRSGGGWPLPPGKAPASELARPGTAKPAAKSPAGNKPAGKRPAASHPAVKKAPAKKAAASKAAARPPARKASR
jgi:hypothetical protein